MIDKTRLGSWAKIFATDDACMIHVESRKGKGAEICISGDPIAMILSILCVLNRIHEVTGMPMKFVKEKISDGMDELIKSGYKSKNSGEHYMPDDMPDLVKVEKAESERNVAELKAVIKSYGEAMETANATIKSLREKEVELRQIHSKEMEALRKENNALEAQLKAMEKRNMFGGGNGQNDI